ncbi:sensor histidine kinase [Neomesorhizobium albiziae]|nr:sensor histidine kinase [Mesorhizobium albiziae]GLS32313.1 hypothetical protein GCM10007937_40230 [Mesorhizobium albiziae]
MSRSITLIDELPARTRIRQALLAVLDNARRYAPQSTIRVEICAVGLTGVIRCSDTGPGLPAGMHEKVFERFWGR